MSDKELNKIAAIEKAIAKKYGKEAVQNPKGNWDEEKEKEYIEQVKKFQEKLRKAETSAEKIEHNGFFVSKKLINKESNKPCPVCSKYTLNVKDDVCM
jgi:predicted ribosome quality control (RQC) complex YloA/Tae2 family protein